jgi:hypothetical protein
MTGLCEIAQNGFDLGFGQRLGLFSEGHDFAPDRSIRMQKHTQSRVIVQAMEASPGVLSHKGMRLASA